MNIQNFIGRKTELERLSTLHKKKTPNLVVVKGRRRIGKSRLINSFASSCSNNKFWSFAGLVPETRQFCASTSNTFKTTTFYISGLD